METDYAKAYRVWLASRGVHNLHDASTLGANDPSKYLKNRLADAFSAGWNARPKIDISPYDSMTIAIGTDAGYTAFHEAIQDGWEPLFHWVDNWGEHFAMRRMKSGSR